MGDAGLTPDPGGLELAGLTVLLGRLGRDQHLLLDGVARSIGAALPNLVRVKRRGVLNTGAAQTVEIVLGEQSFVLRDQRGEITPQVGRVVGGVVISHETCSIDDWLTRLRDALQAAATRSVEIRRALERLT